MAYRESWKDTPASRPATTATTFTSDSSTSTGRPNSPKHVWYSMDFPASEPDNRAVDSEQMRRVNYIEGHYATRKKYAGLNDPMGFTYRARMFLIYCHVKGLANDYVSRALPAMMADDDAYDHCLDLYDNIPDKTNWRAMLDGMTAHFEGKAFIRDIEERPSPTVQKILDENPHSTLHEAVGILYMDMARLLLSGQPVAAKRDYGRLYDKLRKALLDHRDTAGTTLPLRLPSGYDIGEREVANFISVVREYLVIFQE